MIQKNVKGGDQETIPTRAWLKTTKKGTKKKVTGFTGEK